MSMTDVSNVSPGVSKVYLCRCFLQEHHLQRALSAQQVYGTAEALVIPVPEIDDVRKQYDQVYSLDYKLPRQYIHAQTYVDQV